jgi:hypothetical protein
VQYLTYLFWSAFPVVAMLKKFQFIDHFQYEVAAVAVDTITKNVYSVVLLSGNFCILDMVQRPACPELCVATSSICKPIM